MRSQILTISTVLLMILAFAATAVRADPNYYRSTMPDGSVVIGDKPAPGAASVKKIPLASPTQNTSTPPQDNGSNANGSGTSSNDDNIAAADTAVAQAQEKLDAAKAALASGQEPQPGERTGMVNGLSRLNESYMQRIRGLEEAVAAAQKELDAAVAQRNALRP